MRIPTEILAITKDIPYTVDNIGRSEDLVLVFEKQYILKISNSASRLLKEKQAVDWLDGKIPGSKSLCYLEKEGKCYYLRTCIVGDSLISERFIKNPQLLIEVLEKVINTLKSLDNYQCPFNSVDNTGLDFIHGDLCLPNIFVNEKNEFIGFIDLENSGRGDRWYDYAWLFWSVWYNLKTLQYHQALIDKLGIVYDYQKIVEYLPLEYRDNLRI